MAADWLTIRVELLEGRGEPLEPAPGRVYLVGPRHTFADLAEAIDSGFARWDIGHLSEFELSDGRRLGPVDEDAPADLEDRASTAVSSAVRSGEEFTYVFDFGDQWVHSCRVEGRPDPEDIPRPATPLPVAIEGWGWIPDQYGREREDEEPG